MTATPSNPTAPSSDAAKDKTVEKAPAADPKAAGEEVRTQFAVAMAGAAPLVGAATGHQNELASMAQLNWKDGSAHISNPQGDYDRALALAGGGTLTPTAQPGDGRTASKTTKTGGVELGAPVAPLETAPAASEKTDTRDAGQARQQVEAWLAGDAHLSAQVTEMRGHLQGLPEPQRKEAESDLDAMLLRGTPGYAATRSGPNATEEQRAELARNPQLTADQLTETLRSLNTAMATSSDKLSPLMGSDTKQENGKSERENNRDLVVAQALRNFGDTRGIQQSYHQTCLLDSKIADEARHSPEIAAANLKNSMLSPDGHVKLQNGTDVKLDASWMRPDNEARQSEGGPDAHGMSADVRMLTGLYANALTQHRTDGSKQIFTMSMDGRGAIDNADSGDRVRDYNTGELQTTANGRYADTPMVDGDDSSRLSAMTKDGCVFASNPSAFHFHPSAGSNFVDLSGPGGEDRLKQLIDSKGSAVLGLNANILFRGSANGQPGGGHATSVTGYRTDANGQVEFHIQDTNQNTSAWYPASTVMAAINNDKSFTASSLPHLDQPGQTAAITPSRPGERQYTPEGGQAPGGVRVLEPVAHPNGVITQEEQRQQLQDLRPETDAEKKARQDLEHERESEDKLLKGTLQAVPKDEYDRELREQQQKLRFEEAVLNITLKQQEEQRRKKEEDDERRKAEERARATGGR